MPTILGRTAFDLTQPLSPRTPRSSDHPEVRFESVRWRSRHGLKTSTVTMSVHTGTHVDAPSLYYPGADTVDRLDLSVLCGSAVIVDAERPDWGEITAEDLIDSEVEITEGDIVILRTTWHRHFGDEERYILKAPGITKDAIDWLVQRRVRAVGSDSPSPEHIFMRAKSWTKLRPDVFERVSIDPLRFPPNYGHRTLLQAGIPLIEGLGGDIDDIVNTRVDLLVFPLLFSGVEAAQARVVALASSPSAESDSPRSAGDEGRKCK